MRSSDAWRGGEICIVLFVCNSDVKGWHESKPAIRAYSTSSCSKLYSASPQYNWGASDGQALWLDVHRVVTANIRANDATTGAGPVMVIHKAEAPTTVYLAVRLAMRMWWSLSWLVIMTRMTDGRATATRPCRWRLIRGHADVVDVLLHGYEYVYCSFAVVVWCGVVCGPTVCAVFYFIHAKYVIYVI